jgi:hypothetical protein
MKRIKIAMAALVLTAGMIASFAFTSKKNASKPVFNSIYYYDQAQAGVTITSYNIASLVNSEIQNDVNWVLTQQNASSQNGSNLAAMEFPEETTMDGSADGFITLHEAEDVLVAIKSLLNTTSPQPMSVFVAGSSGTSGNVTMTFYKRQ